MTGGLVSVLICHDFATPCLALLPFVQRIRDFSNREVNFYAAKADNALEVGSFLFDHGYAYT